MKVGAGVLIDDTLLFVFSWWLLQLLLTHDSDSVHITSVLKETPLFFAAKNDFIECAQLLVSYGAATDIHNLRLESFTLIPTLVIVFPCFYFTTLVHSICFFSELLVVLLSAYPLFLKIIDSFYNESLAKAAINLYVTI